MKTMNRIIGKTFSLSKKIVIFLAAFAIVAYTLIILKVWSMDLNTYFLRTGKWPELVFVVIIVFAIAQILEKLLRWEYRAQTRR